MRSIERKTSLWTHTVFYWICLVAISESKRVIKPLNFNRFVGFFVKLRRNRAGILVGCDLKQKNLGRLNLSKLCLLRILFGVCVFPCPKSLSEIHKKGAENENSGYRYRDRKG